MTQGRRLVALMCGLLVAGGLTGCYPAHETAGKGTPFRSNMWQRHDFDYMVYNLRQRGVQVVRVGDKTRLILSTDNFFKINSVEFEPGAQATLQWVARMLDFCRCQQATITGHVDNVFKDARKEPLALQQARAVAAELWANGIAHERMMVSGESNQVQVATDRTVFGSGDNRRIEIRLD
jgi:outer membrane protein OmpA-like peptidoglycan-associated protein